MKLPDASALGVATPPSRYSPPRASAAGFNYLQSRDTSGPIRQLGSQFLAIGLSKQKEQEGKESALQEAQANADLMIQLDKQYMEQSNNPDYHNAPRTFRENGGQILDNVSQYIKEDRRRAMWVEQHRPMVERYGFRLDNHAQDQYHSQAMVDNDKRIAEIFAGSQTDDVKLDSARKILEKEYWLDPQQRQKRIQGFADKYSDGKAWQEILSDPDAAEKKWRRRLTPTPGPQSSLRDRVKRLEGYAPTAKWDYKQYTNGYGTRATAPGEKIDKATAERRLDAALADAASVVDSVNPNLPSGVRDALISLTFNAGSKWTSAGLGQAIRAGDFETAKKRFLAYNKAGGKYNQGLANRRRQEAAWFDGEGPTDASVSSKFSVQLSAQSRIPHPSDEDVELFAPEHERNGGQFERNGDWSDAVPVRKALQYLRAAREMQRAKEREQEEAEREIRNEVVKQGDDLLKAGGMTEEWVAENRDILSPDDYRRFLKATVPDESNRKTDPHVYLEMEELVDRHPDLAIEKANELWTENQFAKSDRDKIVRMAEEKMRGPSYTSEIRSFIKQRLTPPIAGLKSASTMAKQLDAMFFFDDWVEAHPNATREDMRKQSDIIVSDMKEIIYDKETTQMPLPRYTGKTRDTMDVDEISRLRDVLRDKVRSGELKGREAASEAAILRRWQSIVQWGRNAE